MSTQPLPGILYGITHNKDTGQSIIRQVRALKVGIGLPKGRAAHVFKHQGEWVIRHGKYENKKLVMRAVFKTKDRVEAEKWYNANLKDAAFSDHPQKIPFFTFTKRSLVEENGKPVEVFTPDFASIDAHGDTPREIDIILMSEDPRQAGYQMWGASDLKCYGDGVNAMRAISLLEKELTPEAAAAWPGLAEAKASGQKYIAIQPCWTDGCPYAEEGGGCKPGTTLNFQLANNMRIGATAYFHTTSYRSVVQIHSAMESIRMVAERAGSSIVGLPLKLVLIPFRSNHNGIGATQYGVSLELRAEDMATLRKRLAESAWTPKQLVAPPQFVSEEPITVPTEVAAPAMAAEFYPEIMDGDDDGESVDASGGAAAATDSKTAALAEKLAAKRTASAGSMDAKPVTPKEDATPVATPTLMPLKDLF